MATHRCDGLLKREGRQVLKHGQVEELLKGIDAGVQAHLAWNQRLLRCALLLESPGDDMLRPRPHTLCAFGIWFSGARKQLDQCNVELAAAIDTAHESMHAAVRAMCIAKLGGERAAGSDLMAFEEGQCQMLARLAELRHQIVLSAASKDPLTKLPLRHGLEAAFEHCQKESRDSGAGLFIAMIDLDRFKNVNDTWGHAVGDAALVHVAAILRTGLRDVDPLFRYGGEEFLALLRCVDETAAQVVVTRLLMRLREAPLAVRSGVMHQLTCTIGLAEVGPNEALHDAMERADHAMLLGKVEGRDRVNLSSPPHRVVERRDALHGFDAPPPNLSRSRAS